MLCNNVSSLDFWLYWRLTVVTDNSCLDLHRELTHFCQIMYTFRSNLWVRLKLIWVKLNQYQTEALCDCLWDCLTVLCGCASCFFLFVCFLLLLFFFRFWSFFGCFSLFFFSYLLCFVRSFALPSFLIFQSLCLFSVCLSVCFSFFYFASFLSFFFLSFLSFFFFSFFFFSFFLFFVFSFLLTFSTFLSFLSWNVSICTIK